MAYATDYTTATTTAFVNKVQLAIVATAIAISNEAANTANHAARVALASKVLANPAGYAQLMAFGMATSGATDNNSSDGTLDSRISAIWNSYT
jgi:hypothetical protein